MNQEDYKIAYENVMVANKMLEQEIERLNDIIKEVREYIYNNSFDEKRKEIKDILQILDKGKE